MIRSGGPRGTLAVRVVTVAFGILAVAAGALGVHRVHEVHRSERTQASAAPGASQAFLTAEPGFRVLVGVVDRPRPSGVD